MSARATAFTSLVRTRFDYWTEELRLPTTLVVVPGEPVVAGSDDLRCPGGYHGWSNTLVVDVAAALLPFADREIHDRRAMVTYIDGLLLHELGHRRDRWWVAPHRAALAAGGWLLGGLFIVAFLVEALSEASSWWAIPAMVLVIVAAAIAYWVLKIVVVKSIRWRARLELRADDYACDVGGIEAIDEMLWASEVWPTIDLLDGVYLPLPERRARQWQRATGAGVPVERTGEWGSAADEDSWWKDRFDIFDQTDR
ncbi:hypothetical protein [Gordonia malaquae]|uniref:hypothetical protein n=1 Tax=Gordonia malaquae TaxID=410332 RepID=UPI003016EFB8